MWPPRCAPEPRLGRGQQRPRGAQGTTRTSSLRFRYAFQNVLRAAPEGYNRRVNSACSGLSAVSAAF
eukprot:14239946-Alexandrium_andersonii.AAC.1